MSKADKKPRIVEIPRPPRRAWKASESGDILSGWITAARPPDVDIRNALRPLRARSREQAQNNDLVRAFLRECKTNVIGPRGIKHQSRLRFANGRQNRRVNEAVEAAWRRWSSRGQCDVTGQLSFRDVCNLAIEAAAKDGEFLIRIVRGWQNDLGFALQVIDSEALDVGYDEELSDGRRIVMGVELDAWRRPIAYHLTDEPTNPYMQAYSQQAKRKRVSADDIIHGYLPEWVWQTRGVPWSASSLWRLKMVGGYEEAAVTAARESASKMAFYETDGESGPVGLSGERNEAGDLVKEAVPGGMEELPPGYKVSTVDWGWPNSDHGQFMRPVMRNIAAGLGVGYHTWGQDLEGVNYSSIRHGSLTERDVWRGLQQWLIEWLCEPVNEAFLESAVVSGALLVDGRPIAQDVSRLRDATHWQPRGWQWIDPQKEAQAAEQSLRMRTRSISSIIRERGEDPEDVWDELASDITRLNELGLPPIIETGEQLEGDEPGAPAPTEED